MLRSIKKLYDRDVSEENGFIGTLDRVLFDRYDWNIKCFIAEGRSNFYGEQRIYFPVDSIDIRWDEKTVLSVIGKCNAERPELCGGLLSTQDIIGYEICLSDGDLGKVDDLAVDENTWRIKYLITVPYRSFGTGRILLNPQCIETVSPALKVITMDMTAEMVFKACTG